MGLGPFPPVSLRQARIEAEKAKAMLYGVAPTDPLEVRNSKNAAERAEVAKRITFKECAEKYIASHEAGWKNPKHAQQWPNSLEAYAYPVLGNLNVAAIDTAHIMKALEPIWHEKTDTAGRVRGRIEAVLDWAKARHFRQGENPARWKGHLDNLLPAKAKIAKTRHQPAMPFLEIPAFMEKLRATDGMSARALEFTILTAARTTEAIEATWDEFDLKERVWTVPGERMKAGRAHRVPLSDRTVDILKGLKRLKNEAYVFPGRKKAQPLSNMAMLVLLRGMRDDGLTVHGFRSSFRDWAGEQTNFPREVAEAALGHVVGDKVEAAYRRGDALEKRQRLMAAWATFCSKPRSVSAGNVTAIRGRK
jgi:integrase